MLVFGIISLLPARAFFMLKFYILLSNAGGFLRHFSPDYSNLSPDEAEVVINTQTLQNQKDIAFLCDKFGVTYHITESNGTPAKGKNELLKIFEASDNDYCVQIDGDDYLTPHGVWLYKNIAASKTVPDAICIKNGAAVCHKGTVFEYKGIEVRKFFTIDYESLDYQDMYNQFCKRLPTDLAEQYVNYHKDYYGRQEIYCEDSDAHCRVVFFSKVAAAYKFNEDVMVGEDTLQYFDLKHAHMQRHLNFVCNDEAPATYIYNQLDGWGTVFKTTKGHTDWSWMGEFNEYVDVYLKAGKLHDKDLPLLKVHYTEGYVLDDLDTLGLCRYEKQGLSVELPANATAASVNYHLLANGKSIEK